MNQKPHRKCLRCDKPAAKAEGRSLVSKLCLFHQFKREQKQIVSARQPNCRCGNKVGLGKELCAACEAKEIEEVRHPLTILVLMLGRPE